MTDDKQEALLLQRDRATCCFSKIRATFHEVLEL